MSTLSEDELIATVFAPLAGKGGLGLRDDAALLEPEPGWDLVVTVDAVVAGVHFFPDDPPASIARKALGVNLSDLAAKGATPIGFVLALSLPLGWTSEWLRDLARGLGVCAAEASCPLLGGDTVGTPGPLTLSITAFGSVPQGTMVRRTGAKAGDRLYVSGTIGDAALGLRVRRSEAGQGGAGSFSFLTETQRATLLDRYLHPQPRLALAPALRNHASGAMDVSDGLVGDASKLLAASGIAGWIELARVPFSEAALAMMAADPAASHAAMTGGDDYEILATVPVEQCRPFEDAADRASVAVTLIGEVAAGHGPVQIVGPTGEQVPYERGSFSHF